MFFIASFMLNKDVCAYVDPGTGVAIIGSIWPLIIAFFSAIIAFIVKYFWEPIKRFISKLLRLKKKK